VALEVIARTVTAARPQSSRIRAPPASSELATACRRGVSLPDRRQTASARARGVSPGRPWSDRGSGRTDEFISIRSTGARIDRRRGARDSLVAIIGLSGSVSPVPGSHRSMISKVVACDGAPRPISTAWACYRAPVRSVRSRGACTPAGSSWLSEETRSAVGPRLRCRSVYGRRSVSSDILVYGTFLEYWRRGWDSNPRYGLSPYNGLANRRLQPLGHPSAGCPVLRTHRGHCQLRPPDRSASMSSRRAIVALVNVP
jgi:hypothetical protein